MTFTKWPVLGAAALAVGLLAHSETAVAPASAAVSPNPFTFIPGLQLNGSTGTTTGAAEPSIRVDSGGHVYVTGPLGVPNGGCPLWFVHPDSRSPVGLPYDYRGKFDIDHNGPGGGDCDLATGGLAATNGFDNLAASSLSLANLTVNQSADGGKTFHAQANPIGTPQQFGLDRQWNAADTGIGQVYMTVHDAATDNIQVSDSTDGGYTYVPNLPAIDATHMQAAVQDNHFGNIVVNPVNHKLYTVYVAPATAAENAAAQNMTTGPNEHVVYVAEGNPCAVSCAKGTPLGPITWTDHTVYNAPSPTGTNDLGHIFPSIAIDGAGTVYVVWSDTHHVFISHSTNPGVDGTWSKPIAVDISKNANSNMFPWVVAGMAGVVDVVWYSAYIDPKVCPAGQPTDNSQGVNNNCHNRWDVEFAQSRTSASTSGSFARGDASSRHSIHVGSLCDQGLNCSIFGGDRTLLDYFQVALDPLGAANVAYASDIASPGTANIVYTRQCVGPSATSNSMINYSCAALTAPPPPPPAPVCNGAHVATDPAGDAVNPTGAPGSTSQVDITNVAFSSTATTLTTTLTIANLSNTPVAGTADSYYYVAWKFGTTWYATLDTEPSTGSTEFTYGTFNPSTNQLTASNTATSGTFTAGANGTIAITVPLSGVGNPTIPVTLAHKAHAAAIGPYGVTISGEGAAGSGLVFTHPDDRAPDAGPGASWSVC